MSEKHPKELIELLWSFMLEVSIYNDDLYPPLSLGNLLRFGYSCTRKFTINRYNESKTTIDSDFPLHEDVFAHYVS